MSKRMALTLVAVPLALLTIVAACGGGDEEETPGAQPAETASPGGAALEIAMIPTIKFDKDELRVPADQSVAIKADNRDTGVSHNFAVYDTEEDAQAGEDPLYATDICESPCQNTLTIKIDAGEHFFRCDVHPTQMTGRIIGE